MKLGEILPPGHHALLFSTSGTGFDWIGSRIRPHSGERPSEYRRNALPLGPPGVSFRVRWPGATLDTRHPLEVEVPFSPSRTNEALVTFETQGPH